MPKGKFAKHLQIYKISDLYIISMAIILAVVNLAASPLLDNWLSDFFTLIILIILPALLITHHYKLFGDSRTIEKSRKFHEKFIFYARQFYFPFAVLTIYTIFQPLIKTFHPVDFDLILNQWDIALLGMKAAEVFSGFANPFLTEFLQITYTSFYFLPLIVGFELYRRHNDEFDLFARNIIFTFFFSYILYFIMPAIGPRFVVYDFAALDKELPGVFLTHYLREAINFGGGVFDKTVNPALIVNRDCMPSGHTMITLATIFWAYRLNTKVRHIILIFGISLIFATIYLRYHYLVDIIAGIIFAALSLWLEPIFNKYFRNIVNKI